jgi:uncharacterized damage-inducible protein DinB
MSISYDLHSPAELHPELGLLWATLEDGSREWLENMEPAPTRDAMTWQAYPNSPSVGGILLHMISADKFWISEVALGEELDETHPARAYDVEVDQDSVKWPAPPDQPWEWYLNLYQEGRKGLLESLKRVSGPEKVLTRPSGNSFTVRWILAHLVQHDSYHAGQMIALNEMHKATH